MSKGKLVAVCCVWLVILGIGAMVWKWWIAPSLPEPPPPPGPPGVSPSFFEHEITFALDSFSGYSVVRSEAFDEE